MYGDFRDTKRPHGQTPMYAAPCFLMCYPESKITMSVGTEAEAEEISLAFELDAEMCGKKVIKLEVVMLHT